MLRNKQRMPTLNNVSADVSKRLQDLVSARIDNMTKADALGKRRDEKSRDYQRSEERRVGKECA